MTDDPVQLRLVSPCIITLHWDGCIFADLEASFSQPSLRYHCVGKFMFSPESRGEIVTLARETTQCRFGVEKKPVLRMKTVEKMTVFDLMTGGDEGAKFVNKEQKSGHTDGVDGGGRSGRNLKLSLKDKIDRHNDNQLDYENIAMPEVDVDVFYDDDEEHFVRAKMKLKRVLRYHHLTRDYVDEKDYPPTQEYFLYSDQKNAYLSHCPNRFPDFQQLIYLDNIPLPSDKHRDNNKNDLYKEALERGVVVYLPEISCGGKPVTSKNNKNVCKDPVKLHSYNAISWSDQGAFTGDMSSIQLRFQHHGVRWFDGKKINKNYMEPNEKFGYLFQKNTSEDSDSSEDDSDHWEMYV